MENILEVESVYAGYVEDFNILQGINFRVTPGELVAVIGPNGAGKSTLAKTIFGLLTPNQGKIIFKGKNIVRVPSDKIVRHGMCYVPQISNVFSALTIDENLEVGAFIKKGSLKQDKDRIYTMFPRLGERRRQRAGKLSGGERQLLAMGRALMLDPDLLLLDEPSAALSPILVNNIFEQIKAINRMGKAIVLVEQNAKKALLIADRGYVLENGCDRLEGSGESLLGNPKVGRLYLGAAYQK
ncbi:MAG: ABC transporter ATP-binding protein [cyanobacterium endosymbiont of Rhopalodia musculus]|uniref:ABC transporter ATP-binding protein n=1 Tax=cyanobacterium endosymbiont of Epithemia clementina EcSB TaxID=3034674 RepID=UPI0024809B14|nr:ABC transporter ATP-binding protein [cyanobacterium endosymbiont of Epithemia clementina EcSB]WGT68264.1 ABC transporter ATP-binding protein [cyanobacterium endosymbiont of Epithemia clementina EcSB]